MSTSYAQYHIQVDVPEEIAGQWEDERPDPLVLGILMLSDDEKALLERRLTALHEADLIGDWLLVLNRPKALTVGDVLSAIVADYEDDEEVNGIWYSTE